MSRKPSGLDPCHYDFWMYVPIFNANLYIYVGENFEAFKTWCGSQTSIPESQVLGFFQSDNANATTYGYFGDAVIYSPRPIRRSVLVHELLHYTQMLLRHRDLGDSEELQCYVLEYVYAQVMTRMQNEMFSEEARKP